MAGELITTIRLPSDLIERLRRCHTIHKRTFTGVQAQSFNDTLCELLELGLEIRMQTLHAKGNES